MDKIVTTQIDDRDPAVVYLKSGKWSQQASSAAFNDTLTLTREKGATATLIFQGTRVSVYGQVAAGGTHALNPTSSYNVDGAPPTMFTGAQNGSTHTQTRFFRSPPLADGPHALVVTALGAGAYFWLDFFVVEEPAENSNNSVVNGGIPVAAVAGEILGVVLAVVLLLLAVVYVVRRRRGKGPRSEIAMSVITSASAQESTHASPWSGRGVSNEADGTSRACASVSLLDAPEGARPIPQVQGLFARALNTEQTDLAIVPASWSWGDEGESPPEYTLESA